MFTIKDFKESVRGGAYTFPGGYPKIWVAKDGGVLCHSCCKDNAKLIIEAIRGGYERDWCIVACDINWEDEYLQCDNCYEPIENAC